MDGLKVEGARNAGGLIGRGGRTSTDLCVINNCTTERKIYVSGGRTAGGFIGYENSTDVRINDGDDYSSTVNIGLIEKKSSDSGWNDTFTCAGGLIGRTSDNSKSTIIKNVTVNGNPDISTASIFGNGKNNENSPESIGGIVGYMQYCNLTVENCQINKVGLHGDNVGGVLGFIYYRGICNFSNITVTGDETNKTLIEAEDKAGGIYGWAHADGNNTDRIVTMNLNNVSVSNLIIKSCSFIKDNNGNYTSCAGRTTSGGIGGFSRVEHANKETLTIYCNNAKVENCDLKSTMGKQKDWSESGVGAFFGTVNGSNTSLYGYNCLSNNNRIYALYEKSEIESMTSKNSEQNQERGILVGSNYNESTVIKFSGVSVQNVSENSPQRYVGKQGGNLNDNYYGTNGYIIFSDYNGKCLTNSRSETFSPITNSTNITAYDGTAVTDNTPYVTSSPKMEISASQFLTGDGVSALNYNNSAAKTILNDIIAGTSTKRYKNTVFSNIVNGTTSSLTASAFSTQLASKLSTYQAEMGELAGTTYDFPVLIFDDTTADNTTNLLNNYLRTLTNTSYDFATDQAGVYAVKTAKCTWNGTDFTADYTTSNLIHQNNKFYMENDKVDNAAVDDDGNPVGQFSLVDVEFYDPSDATKVAYHLYVPVVVKKLTKFEFEASLLSGTTYRVEPYLTNRANTLIENLGTPVTMQFRYTYQQSLLDWQNAIYSGDSVLYSFNKVLLFDNKATADSIPSMNMVLIDVNQGRKSYTATLTDSGVYANSKLDLQKFKDSSDNAYQSVLFNDYFTITAETASENDVKFSEVTLTDGTEETVENYISAGATVRDSSGKYYKRDDNGTVKLTISYADTASTVTRTVDGIQVQYLQEDYYLSYFTSTQDNKIAHFEIDSVTAFDNTAHPTRRETSSVCHLYLGDIFENVLTVTPTNPTSKISNSNHTIGADLSATISLKASAKNYVQAAITRIPNVDIYQCFMVSLRKQNSATDYSQGIAVKPTIQLSNTQVGTGTSTEDWKYYISSNYIELRNNVDLQDYLKNRESVVVNATIAMTYSTASDSTDITDQFPYRTQEQESDGNCVIGTRIIGYSSIGSAPETAVYSKASKEQTTAKLYYCTVTTNAKLNYMSNASAANRVNGVYDQLGINALESSATSMKIDTLAEYRTGKLTTLTYAPARTTIEVEFSEKGAYGTPLDIPKYLTSFNLYKPDEDSDTGYSVVTDRTETGSNGEKTKYTYTIENPQNALDYDSTNKIYSIPIDFTAKTGSELESAGLDYANYMVKLTVKLYKLEGSTYEYIPGSEGNDHIIYTNTKVLSELVTSSGS